jgi:hypothetical protein
MWFAERVNQRGVEHMIDPGNMEPGNAPREPEIPVIDDPAEPAAPKPADLPPPTPDPPEIIGGGRGGDRR